VFSETESRGDTPGIARFAWRQRDVLTPRALPDSFRDRVLTQAQQI